MCQWSATPVSIIASGGGPQIDIDGTLLIQLAIFLAMFFLLRQLLFRPVVKLIEARRNATSGTKENADGMTEEARKLNEDVDKQLDKIRTEAAAQRTKMIEKARAEERDILSKARDDAHSVVEKAKEETAAQAGVAKEALKNEVAQLAQSVTAKVLGRQI